MDKSADVTEMALSLDELDNTDSLEDGKLSNILHRYHETDSEEFTSFEPVSLHYKKLRNGEFASLALRITDQSKNNVILGVTVVLHICD